MEELNLKFIIAAYSVSWVVILGYLARLMRKGSHARADYDHMSREIPGGGPR
jgi:CcmD family protein